MDVRWLPRAISDYQVVLSYLELKWGRKVREAFIGRVMFVIGLIEKFPKLYPVSSKKLDIRRCVITKQTSIFYRASENQIEIIAFRDNRKKK